MQYVKTVKERWFDSIDKKFFTLVGDILINSTGEGTIGRATCINTLNEGLIYDSHILLLRLNQKKIVPEFFTFLFNSSYGQNQVENIKSAQSTKQTELGINNLKKIVFPLPPIREQNQIVNHISNLKQQIKDLLAEAKQNRAMAIKKFEEEIFNS